MSDKERLEEIRNSCLEGKHIIFGTSWVSMPKEDFDFLIKQAERVQELENYLKLYYFWYRTTYEQNKRYREAINHIIEKAILFGTNEEVYDAIQDAFRILEGEK